MIQEPNNEQKLTYIYETLRDQEKRRKHLLWYRIIKWLLLLGLVYWITRNPGLIIEKTTAYLQPIIVEQVRSTMDENKDTIVKSVEGIIKTTGISLPRGMTLGGNQTTSKTGTTSSGVKTPPKK